MKRIISLIIIFIFVFFTSCTTSGVNVSKSIDEPSISQKKQASILTMNDLMVIKLAADYLKEQGETVEFDETEMILHNEHKDTVLLPVIHGEHIEYSDSYLEVVMYQNTSSGETPCRVCFTVYMSENGKIIGYNK